MQKKPGETPAPSKKEHRVQRLSQALKANLQRRKTATRATAAAPGKNKKA